MFTRKLDGFLIFLIILGVGAVVSLLVSSVHYAKELKETSACRFVRYIGDSFDSPCLVALKSPYNASCLIPAQDCPLETKTPSRCRIISDQVDGHYGCESVEAGWLVGVTLSGCVVTVYLISLALCCLKMSSLLTRKDSKLVPLLHDNVQENP